MSICERCQGNGELVADFPGGEKSPQVTIDTGNNHPLK